MDDRTTRLQDFALVAMAGLIGMGISLLVAAGLVIVEWLNTGCLLLPGFPPCIR